MLKHKVNKISKYKSTALSYIEKVINTQNIISYSKVIIIINGEEANSSKLAV